MRRLFDDHIKRRVAFLDGVWQMQTDPSDVGLGEGWEKGLPATIPTVIPSVWNTDPALSDYEGVVWYAKDFYFEGGCARLVFEAVMTECRVWLDGEPLGSHYGGFCEFDFLIPSLEAGKHSLVLRVDNRFDKSSIPQREVDWYHYGGITRSVSIETLRGLTVLSEKCEYTLSESLDAAELILSAEVYAAEDMHEAPLSLSLDGEVLYCSALTLRRGECTTLRSDPIRLSSPRLWSPDSPYLYTLTAETETDDLIDRIGLRRIEVKDCALCLNGKPLRLRGVNRHEDHPDFGMAFPPALMQRDIDIVCSLGCNALRGSHYPNARIFLDMLDARGILFWSEIPIWGVGFSVEALADPRVVARGLEMHREMVKAYYNHPSIILWGMHNEIRSDTEPGYEMSRQYYAFLKENGGNRLVTFASHKPMSDICFAFCDVISLNQYHGWYTGTIEHWGGFLRDFDERRRALGFADKPMIMSEFGAAAAYGHRGLGHEKWTEEYQAELIRHCLAELDACPYVVGSYIWQLFDMRSNKDLAKARELNNKGILNEHRRPKLAYYAVREAYLAQAEKDKN